MSAIDQTENQDIKNILHHPNIDEYIFISLIAASFIGELIILEKSVGHGICGKSGRKRQIITRR